MRRIAVIGAECTGKSSLCEALSARLPAVLLPEVLREFCERHARTPRADEQAALIAEQMLRERAALADGQARGLSWLVIDSSPLATALYSLELFGDASLLEAAIAHQRACDVTLLADIDLPWVADGSQRDGPQARASFHRRLLETLAGAGIVYTVLSGPLPLRLALAERVVGTRQRYHRDAR